MKVPSRAGVFPIGTFSTLLLFTDFLLFSFSEIVGKDFEMLITLLYPFANAFCGLVQRKQC